MTMLLLLLLLRVLLRLPWLAAVVFCALTTVWFTPATAPEGTYPWAGIGVVMVLLAVGLLRLGLLPVMIAIFLTLFWINSPITLDFGAWYGGATVFFLLVILALVGAGFHNALAGRPLLGRALSAP